MSRAPRHAPLVGWLPDMTDTLRKAEAVHRLGDAIEIAAQHIDAGLQAIHAGDFARAHCELWDAWMTWEEPTWEEADVPVVYVERCAK